MKLLYIIASTCLAMTLIACTSQTASQDEVETTVVGADRDSNGCIGSAGYQWSDVAGECIRVFERGIALTDLNDLEAPSVAYLVSLSDKAQLELFLLDGSTAVLNESAEGEWQDNTGEYLIKFSPPAMYSVFDQAGQTLHYESRNEDSSAP